MTMRGTTASLFFVFCILSCTNPTRQEAMDQTQAAPSDANHEVYFTDRNDFGVQLLLRLDSTYNEALRILESEKGMNKGEAEAYIKRMMKNGLLQEPQIICI